ncbi:hypothetical protein JYU34_000626 [Plutella xylostella]|uniref:Uncharacterized protein n=1 Tax=Plutella xylostella TaxID=51655 RepID=A0ABQ7R880_PLUXY|nr:hypothetical protein JYU34_000626 [Plutella xylostella]
MKLIARSPTIEARLVRNNVVVRGGSSRSQGEVVRARAPPRHPARRSIQTYKYTHRRAAALHAGMDEKQCRE